LLSERRAAGRDDSAKGQVDIETIIDERDLSLSLFLFLRIWVAPVIPQRRLAVSKRKHVRTRMIAINATERHRLRNVRLFRSDPDDRRDNRRKHAAALNRFLATCLFRCLQTLAFSTRLYHGERSFATLRLIVV